MVMFKFGNSDWFPFCAVAAFSLNQKEKKKLFLVQHNSALQLFASVHEK